MVTGGTGFYLRALLDGLAPGPLRDETLRARLRAREAAGSIHRLLRRLDPSTAARIHPNDIPKVDPCARNLHFRAPDARPRYLRPGGIRSQGFRVLKIGLFPNREQLYRRLESRMEAMFSAGLIEETASILARGYAARLQTFESIGYKQALQTIRGELSPKEALFYAAARNPPLRQAADDLVPPGPRHRNCSRVSATIRR